MYRCAFGTVRALVAIRNAGLNIATVYPRREKTVVVKLANALERRGRFLAIIERLRNAVGEIRLPTRMTFASAVAVATGCTNMTSIDIYGYLWIHTGTSYISDVFRDWSHRSVFIHGSPTGRLTS